MGGGRGILRMEPLRAAACGNPHGRGLDVAAILTALIRLSVATFILCSMSLTLDLRGWRWSIVYLEKEGIEGRGGERKGWVGEEQ